MVTTGIEVRHWLRSTSALRRRATCVKLSKRDFYSRISIFWAERIASLYILSLVIKVSLTRRQLIQSYHVQNGEFPALPRLLNLFYFVLFFLEYFYLYANIHFPNLHQDNARFPALLNKTQRS